MRAVNEFPVILALDVNDLQRSLELTERYSSHIKIVKVNYRLVLREGKSCIDQLLKKNVEIFLDLKLHDIPYTVEETSKIAADLGIKYLTVHAYPKTLEAAQRGALGTQLNILGVSVMTSYSEEDVSEMGYTMSLEALMQLRCRMIDDSGVSGVVCSGLDAPRVRALLGADRIIVVPGVRIQPLSSETGVQTDYHDQKRVVTPVFALNSGADYVVLGRALLNHVNPEEEFERLVESLKSSNLYTV